MKIPFRPLLSLLIIATGLTAGAGDINIIPAPVSVVETKGSFILPSAPTYSVAGADSIPGISATTPFIPTTGRKADIRIRIDGKGTPESYTLRITPRGIDITAPDAAGAFYACQTLRQITAGDSRDTIPAMTVTDAPRFPYRGLHFDVSRHFRPVEFLEKQIDAMALLKLNRMHLHLTDGAGWRMPVESYPRLNTYAAWRPQRAWQDWADNGATYCSLTQPGAYGGYYSKDELRHLVDYAARRNITIIPEIEMPGHSEEVTAAYPELACKTGEKSSDLCPGKEATFTFLEKVLDEVIDIFPSHYIHIGGDEASMAAWRDCPDCAARMKAEGFDDVNQLQSYLITRIEKYLNSRGRDIIGWDEILQGGIAPNATVMSWRGQDGGLKAIQANHDVIMTPGEFCYLDYCQDAPFREPVSIGGYTPLEKVYSYEPMHPDISPQNARHLLGVQGNLWAEYITDDTHAEYMYYPRAYALAEIAWSPAGTKNYPDFRRRAIAHNQLMQNLDYNTFDLANEFGQRHEATKNVNHAALGATVIYENPYAEKYAAQGPATLTDGQRGGWSHSDQKWQGFTSDFFVTVDLGELTDIHFIDISFLHAPGAWIHLPPYVDISTSTDNTYCTPHTRIYSDIDPQSPKTLIRPFATPLNTKARYIYIYAPQHNRPGAWLFTDEIIIN